MLGRVSVDQKRRTGNERLDELLGAKNPGHAPAGEAKSLGQTVNYEDIIFVNINHIFLFTVSTRSLWVRVVGQTAALMVEPSQLLV